MSERRDLVVIGGGAGGLVVASVASQLGLEVTLVESKPRLGGDCLHTGCVPSKTLIRAARVASLMRRAGDFGLPPANPAVDMGRVSDHVKSVIDHIQQHDDPARFRGYGCEVLFGPARFVDSHTVQVNERTLSARRFVIATGSRPMVPPIDGLEAALYVTNEQVFDFRELPKRLVVLGGGAVGVEMAQAFTRLGSRVTIIEQQAQLLPVEDSDLAHALANILTEEGLIIQTGTRVARVTQRGAVRRIECDGGTTVDADQILVALGRQPSVEGLGLEAAGIAYDRKGIQVDRRMRTSQKHIYACGDVCGPFPFTHMAEYQAGIVLSNAVFRFPKKADYRVVPWVTYTDPELARVGMTEQQAREQGIDAQVLRFPFRDIDRALTDVETQGEVKLVIRRGRLLGASILGPHAGELIHELVLAMKTRRRVADISATIHAYPTLSQAHRRAVNSGYAGKLFSTRTRTLVRWLNRLLP
jgi:dihydrolipoamide dehydrogenase